MNHLTPSEFVDLLDGQLPRQRQRHAESCEVCGTQLDALRRALHDSAGADVPEPSPLFWEQFSARVRDGIEEPVVGVPWLDWLRSSPRSLVATAAMVVVVAGLAWRMGPSSENREPMVAPSLGAPDAGLSPEDSAQEDEWNAVRAAAETAGWDDVKEAGIGAAPDAAESAIMRLSDSERRRLIALIEEELKRSGD
jgi:hypothetical protein